MRTSVLRAVLALGSVVMLAACGSAMPNGDTAGTTAPFSARAAVRTPCSVLPGIWDFKGSCKTATIGPLPRKFSLALYRDVTLAFGLGKNDLTSRTTYYASDATGRNDVAGTFQGKSFVPYSARACAKGNTCPGKPLIYFNFTIESNRAVILQGDSALAVGASAFPGTSCFPVVWNQGKKGWQPYFGTGPIPPAHGKVAFSIALLALVQGANYFAVACE